MQVKLCLNLFAAFLLLPLVASQTDTRISWISQLKQLRHQLHNCLQSGHGTGLWSCFRTRSLQIFENVMTSDVIPLFEGVRLIAAPNATGHSDQARQAADYGKDLKYLTWFDQLAGSLAKGLTTHTLQINLVKLTERYLSTGRWHITFLSFCSNLYVCVLSLDASENQRNSAGSARVRRHRFNMIITMMFGVTALGAVLVPMGFQMLSIVSGKALLLAKMALLLASINGLKRVSFTGDTA